jgi:mono/diheme cytochrome c family protein
MGVGRRLAIGCLVAAVLAASAAGCAADPREERAALGKEVYTQECSRCHLQSGRGYPGVYPNLAHNPIVELESPEAAIEIVLDGRESMPAFGGELPVQKLAAVLTYIRWAWGNRASGVTPAQVR